MNQKVVRRVLSHLGYTADIVIANNGKEALELIDNNGMPDFILMDLQMYEKEIEDINNQYLPFCLQACFGWSANHKDNKRYLLSIQ